MLDDNDKSKVTEPSDMISVVVSRPEAAESGTLGIDDGGGFVKRISAGKIQASLKALSGTLSTLFQDLKSVGEFELDEVQIAVEISGEGGVALIGSVRAGTKGAITLTFKPGKTKK